MGKILYPRQHCHFGQYKISMYLKRYHDVDISKSGVWRILDRAGLNRLPVYQRYKRHDRRRKRYEYGSRPSRPDRCEVHRAHRGCDD